MMEVTANTEAIRIRKWSAGKCLYGIFGDASAELA
jgi:hypothetical protein